VSVAPGLNPEESNTHQPQAVPFDYSGTDWSWLLTSVSHVESSGTQWPLHNSFDTFTQEDVHALHPPNAGPTRTELLSVEKFQPYRMSRARLDKHRNAEAGPSNLGFSPIPYVSQPLSQPPGGISEATADADTTNISTEEDRATVSNFYCSHIPHVTEWLFGVRSPSGPGSPAAKGGYAHPVH